MVSCTFKAAALAALAASSVSMSMSATAAPVVYNYSTVGFAGSVDTALLSLLGSASSVSGSFIYDAASPMTVRSEDIGYEPGLIVYATGALSQLSGTVAGRSFLDDGNGTVAYGTITAPYRFLTLSADPTPRPGQNTTPVGTSYARQLEGFEVGDYTLNNVRLFWSQAPGGVLSNAELPTDLPSFYGTVALDLVLTADPTNIANVPYYSHTVFFSGLTVQAAAVPEPGALAMGLAGIAGVLVAVRRRPAQAAKA